MFDGIARIAESEVKPDFVLAITAGNVLTILTDV
jgi:hypothetical protein